MANLSTQSTSWLLTVRSPSSFKPTFSSFLHLLILCRTRLRRRRRIHLLYLDHLPISYNLALPASCRSRPHALPPRELLLLRTHNHQPPHARQRRRPLLAVLPGPQARETSPPDLRQRAHPVNRT